jgi:hypothetical protein
MLWRSFIYDFSLSSTETRKDPLAKCGIHKPWEERRKVNSENCSWLLPLRSRSVAPQGVLFLINPDKRSLFALYKMPKRNTASASRYFSLLEVSGVSNIEQI